MAVTRTVTEGSIPCSLMHALTVLPHAAYVSDSAKRVRVQMTFRIGYGCFIDSLQGQRHTTRRSTWPQRDGSRVIHSGMCVCSGSCDVVYSRLQPKSLWPGSFDFRSLVLPCRLPAGCEHTHWPDICQGVSTEYPVIVFCKVCRDAGANTVWATTGYRCASATVYSVCIIAALSFVLDQTLCIVV